jgi:hypothetical protein
MTLLGQDWTVYGKDTPPIHWKRFEMIRKQPRKPDENRWRYLFDTARLAWSKMAFDAEALQSLVKTMGDATDLTDYPTAEEEFWGDKAISASRRTTQEAKSIAIRTNLELLKKKDDQDKILHFLKNELHGKQQRLRKCELSYEQCRLLKYFDDLLTEFDDLSSSANPDVRNTEVFRDRCDDLIEERDDLIKQIQYELAKPDDASVVPRHLKSPRVQVEHTRIKEEEETPIKEEEGTSMQQDEETPMQQDLKTPVEEDDHAPVKQEWSEDMFIGDVKTAVRRLELEQIKNFCDLTGAEPVTAEKTLQLFRWNLNHALDFHFADQEASEQAAPADVDMDADPEYHEAVRLSLLTESSGDDATQYDPPARSSTRRATPHRVARLRREDAITDCSKMYIRPNEIAQMRSEGEIGMPMVMPEGLSQYGAKIAQARAQLRELKVEKEPTEDTSRRGLSHAGLPILLDLQGNFKAHVHPEPPQKSLWEQYRAMRSRLHVQYYGPNTWFENQDPLCGVPLQERAEYARPVEQTQDDDTVSTVDVNDTGGYKEPWMAQAAKAYWGKSEDDRPKETVTVADAVMADDESKIREEEDRAFAQRVHDEWVAEDRAKLGGEWSKVEAATVLSQMTEIDSAQRSKKANDRMRRSPSPIHSDHDSVIGDSVGQFMETIQENSNQNEEEDAKAGLPVFLDSLASLTDTFEPPIPQQRKGRFTTKAQANAHATYGRNVEPTASINPQDLEREEGQLEEDYSERKRALFASNEEDAWDGYDSDADEMDIDDSIGSDDSVIGSDADAEGETDDEMITFASNEEKDVHMSAAEGSEQQKTAESSKEEQCGEQEKYDSPMGSKPDDDVDMDG